MDFEGIQVHGVVGVGLLSRSIHGVEVVSVLLVVSVTRHLDDCCVFFGKRADRYRCFRRSVSCMSHLRWGGRLQYRLRRTLM